MCSSDLIGTHPFRFSVLEKNFWNFSKIFQKLLLIILFIGTKQEICLSILHKQRIQGGFCDVITGKKIRTICCHWREHCRKSGGDEKRAETACRRPVGCISHPKRGLREGPPDSGMHPGGCETGKEKPCLNSSDFVLPPR